MNNDDMFKLRNEKDEAFVRWVHNELCPMRGSFGGVGQTTKKSSRRPLVRTDQAQRRIDAGSNLDCNQNAGVTL